MKKRYWMCIVGPTDADNLGNGADAPMRNAVEKAFEELTEHQVHQCTSGWGLTEDRKAKVMHAWSTECPVPTHELIHQLASSLDQGRAIITRLITAEAKDLSEHRGMADDWLGHIGKWIKSKEVKELIELSKDSRDSS